MRRLVADDAHPKSATGDAGGSEQRPKLQLGTATRRHSDRKPLLPVRTFHPAHFTCVSAHVAMNQPPSSESAVVLKKSKWHGSPSDRLASLVAMTHSVLPPPPPLLDEEEGDGAVREPTAEPSSSHAAATCAMRRRSASRSMSVALGADAATHQNPKR
jgi:hypothetical protein